MTKENVTTIAPADERIRWGRIVIGALILEIALIALAVPLLPVVENPLNGGDPAKNYTLFFIAITAVVFAVAVFAGWWVSRPLSSRFLLHGAAMGIAGILIYLVLVSIPPNTIAKTAAGYGMFWFVVANGAKIAGGMAGAWIKASAKR